MGIIGDLFGKGGDSTSYSPPAAEPIDTSGAMEMVGQMMATMTESMAGMMEIMATSQMSTPDMPTIDTTPKITTTEPVDWTETQNELFSKMRADYDASQVAKKGAMDTVLTSPLLDEEDAMTTKSLLSSGSGK